MFTKFLISSEKCYKKNAYFFTFLADVYLIKKKNCDKADFLVISINKINFALNISSLRYRISRLHKNCHVSILLLEN